MNFRQLIVLLVLSLPAPSAAFAEAQCPGGIPPVRYHSADGSQIETSVMIDGSGPYTFILDTGAQMTIIEPSLAAELRLQPQGSTVILSGVKPVRADLARPDSIEAGALIVRHPLVDILSLPQLQVAHPKVRGILGENFLMHFDLLIDHRRKIFCLDETRRMQQKVAGERLPITASPDFPDDSEIPQPILISVRLAVFGSRNVVLRLDSGAGAPLLYGHLPVMASSLSHRLHAQVAGAALEDFVVLPVQDLHIGKHLLRDIAFVTPLDTAGNPVLEGEEGLLPTTLFERVFVSYADRFVILDTR